MGKELISSIEVFDSISKKLAENYKDETLKYIRSSHEDFDILVKTKRKPHHRKKRKGWEY